MPDEGVQFMPNDHLMNREEIFQLASRFVDMGVNRIRLTGGEPLVRKDVEGIISDLATLPVKIGITSNGFLVDRYIELFKEVNLHALNISLDTLDKDKFVKITRRDYLDRTLENILKSIEAGLNVKVNMVVVNELNHDEVLDFVQWTLDYPLAVRFIEYMPFNGNQWEYDKIYSFKQLLQDIEGKYTVEKLEDHYNQTAKDYRVKGAAGTFGIISSVTNPFCEGCNRIRVTADGKLKNCLFSREEEDLLTLMRSGQDIEPLVMKSISRKHFRAGGQIKFSDQGARERFEENRSMIAIGG